MTTRPKQLSGPPQIRLRASEPDRRFLRLFERRPPALELPGSRSIANRALVAAALAEGKSKLAGITACDDTLAMCEGLKALGVQIEHFPRGKSLRETWQVTGLAGGLRAPQAAIDVGASGTTARFLSAAAALADGPVTLDGSPRMRQRPIAELAEALRELGAQVEILGEAGCPPLRVTGAGGVGAGGLRGGEALVDASRSSQFVSALLLAAPCAASGAKLRLRRGALVSRPFVDLTLQVMRAFGATPQWCADEDAGESANGSAEAERQHEGGEAALRVPPTGYRGARFAVEPDAQAAVYAFAAAAISGGSATALGLPGHSAQADLGVLGALQEMGCEVKRRRRSIRLRGPRNGKLRGIEVDGNAWPDAVLALAVAALFAEGPTTIRGIAHLRLKESDRLAALETELRRLGADARAGADHLHIAPAPTLRGADLHTYDDHRMAMSLALAGLRISGVRICNPGCVAKTWPGFFEALESW
ncbi:MAG: 3-phosphoshikimate 1-carboxyvinyltransferase [Deltaproteobacteria bacterium]|nr:3-phosphoshikimate 1-carboxyvinyltransferase [Deltaproteobacteria bacterium]